MGMSGKQLNFTHHPEHIGIVHPYTKERMEEGGEPIGYVYHFYKPLFEFRKDMDGKPYTVDYKIKWSLNTCTNYELPYSKIAQFGMTSDPLFLSNIKVNGSNGIWMPLLGEKQKQPVYDYFGIVPNDIHGGVWPLDRGDRPHNYDLWDGTLNHVLVGTCVFPKYDFSRVKRKIIDTPKKAEHKIKIKIKLTDQVHRHCTTCGGIIVTTRSRLKAGYGLFCNVSCSNMYKKYETHKANVVCKNPLCGITFQTYGMDEYCCEECRVMVNGDAL